MKNTVDTEMKTWAGVVAESCSNITVTPLDLKEAVKTAVSEEDRSRNFIVYGAEDKVDEKQMLTAIFHQIDTQPEFVEHYRIGTSQDGPIKVKLRRPGAVRDVLTNAKKLKGHDTLGSIFISPDRSVEERVAHKQLIEEMKKKREEDPTKYYFIRRGAVCFAERTNSSKQKNWPDSSSLSPFEKTVRAQMMLNKTLPR